MGGKLGGKKTRQWEERRWERQSTGVRIRGAAPVPFVWDFANCELFKERCDSKAFHQSSYVCTSTTFVSFVGWILFASVFFLFAWQEFDESGVDGRPLVESLAPKLDVFSKHMSANVEVQVSEVEIKNLVVAFITLKGLEGLLFIFSSSLGAHLSLLH